MDVGTILTLVGLVLTAVGLVITAVSLSRRIREKELLEAEARGKMLQRLDEAERDIDRLGAKQRKMDEALASLQANVAVVISGQETILTMLKDIGARLDRHVERRE